MSVFDNTKSVKFHEKDYEKIVAIVSKEDETIELDKPVMAQGNLAAIVYRELVRVEIYLSV